MDIYFIASPDIISEYLDVCFLPVVLAFYLS